MVLKVGFVPFVAYHFEMSSVRCWPTREACEADFSIYL